ncbi:hypothetical protein [Pseudoalteromonas denitrificans]|uniref:Beta-barrel porin 2 n=1 Tax=Pseudoalteromonas denitrificans DSM 6059 TaxID=1123010 RepID=A0A1I1IDN8_9GAMM|nr:hypothetical protein [Pseudoalteromonas denitrificans]SFC32338.1 hypothetical protein SAMN02745724_01423 [Pseudoalteromonas denitrificans DSM 6059]
MMLRISSNCLFFIFFCENINAQSNIPEDPFAQVSSIKPSPYDHDIDLLAYYQNNQVNNNHLFNPDLVEFNSETQMAIFDWQANAHWKNNLQGKSRVILQSDKNTVETNTNAKVLEANLTWTSEDYSWQWQVGRIKTQWSNGFNWSLTNLLKPYRDRPYIDLDDPVQQKGWDMINVRYTKNKWFYQFVIAEFNNETHKNKQQYTARVGYQGINDYSLIIHKQPSQDLDFAVSFNRLINDAITFKMEYSFLHQREQQTSSLFSGIQKNRWQKYLLGSAFTSESGSNYRLEYLNTAHGFSKSEWQIITDNSTQANTNISNNQGSTEDYNYLSAALNSLNYGQLRQNYLYFIYTSALSNNLWQYRQSLQLNIDDNSQLHRLEFLKSWNNHLTSRLQLELFNGCNNCEYGLNPNENSIRLVLNWAF